jgi:hypothetical protein
MAKGRGYSEAEFRTACEDVAGVPLTEVLEYAWTTNEINYAKYLGYAGLSLELNPRSRIVPLPEHTAEQAAIFASWMGED